MNEYNGYRINFAENLPPMVQIKNRGQGPTPKDLRGFFTTVQDAQRAIDLYLLGKRKGNANGPSRDINKG